MGRIADRIRERYNEATGVRETKYATKSDLSRLRRELDRDLKKHDPNNQSGTQVAGRALRMMKKGVDDIGRSMNSPNDNRRPKISQLPGRRSQIGISQGMNLDHLKMPNLRGQNISGQGKKRRRFI